MTGAGAVMAAEMAEQPERLAGLIARAGDLQERVQATGAAGVAVTNDPESDLAAIAHAVLPTEAGPEEAVPATKTVTTQMTALAILAAALGPVPFGADDLERLPEAIGAVLDDPGPPPPLTGRAPPASCRRSPSSAGCPRAAGPWSRARARG